MLAFVPLPKPFVQKTAPPALRSFALTCSAPARPSLALLGPTVSLGYRWKQPAARSPRWWGRWTRNFAWRLPRGLKRVLQTRSSGKVHSLVLQGGSWRNTVPRPLQKEVLSRSPDFTLYISEEAALHLLHAFYAGTDYRSSWCCASPKVKGTPGAPRWKPPGSGLSLAPTYLCVVAPSSIPEGTTRGPVPPLSVSFPISLCRRNLLL